VIAVARNRHHDQAAHARGSICKIWVSGGGSIWAGVQLDLLYGASSCVGGGFERARGSSTASQGDAAQLLLVLGRC
jgi:hypothetical protein